MQIVKQSIVFVLRDDDDVPEFLESVKYQLDQYEGINVVHFASCEVKKIEYADSPIGGDLEDDNLTDAWYQKANEIIETGEIK